MTKNELCNIKSIKMKIELKVYGCICGLEKFHINNRQADYDDFGEKYDAAPDQAEPHG
jgi:hypothetical protein